MSRKLDLGCGQTKAEGYIGMDIFPGAGVDVVHDLDKFPYPFEDNSFEEVRCMSSLEHVGDFLRTIEEIHRILQPGGLLKVWCPHYSGPDAYRDPTHKTFFSYCTFDRFAAGGSYKSAHSGMFSVERRMFGIPEGRSSLPKYVLKKLLNRVPDFYETYLCWMLPTKTIYYELRAIKA